MFKKINNWHLLILIAIVSIVSLALIQQYALAQQWVDPSENPGGTPANNLVVNPMLADLQLNNFAILGTNVTIDDSLTNVLQISNGRSLCLNGDCRNSWLAGTELWAASGSDIYYNDTTGNGNVAIGTTPSPNAKFLVQGDPGGVEAILQVIDSGGVDKVTIDNGGRVGIGTDDPDDDKQLHIISSAPAVNAEIGIQTMGGNHWGIRQQASNGPLIFWQGSDNVTFTKEGDISARRDISASGNITASGTICDITGCIGAGGGSSLWTAGTAGSISRPESSVFLAGIAADLPVTGVGTRLLWYPKKAALRAGVLLANTTAWDDANIGNYSVAFGRDNSAAAAGSTISGGQQNTILSGSNLLSFIGGGVNNEILDSVEGVIVGGGGNKIGNLPNNDAAFIGGGLNNINNGANGVIVGGANNILTSDASFIGGGEHNLIDSPWWSAIVGGENNEIHDNYSFIGGGDTNVVSGQYAVIPGGQYNIANGDFSLAAGRNMQLTSAANGTFVWGNSNNPVSITRDSSFIIFPGTTVGSVPRVGIGTALPNSTLHVKTSTGNAEIDIHSSGVDGDGKHWGIYQNGFDGPLNFWHSGANNVTFSDSGISVVNGVGNDYIQLDNGTPLASDCDDPLEYGRLILDSNNLKLCTSAGWRTI